MKQIIVSLSLVILSSCFSNDKKNAHSETKDEWTRDSTSHFKLQAQKGVRSENNLKAIGERLEDVQKELLVLLNEQEEQNLDVYFLKDRETLTSYTGFPANGYTDTQKDIIYFVDKDPFHLALRHEMMHALSWRLWGNPKEYWISEGVAVYAAGKCGENSLHALAHDINKQEKLISFANLTDTFDFKAIEPSLQSASMVQYICEVYGMSALKGFWEKGLDDAQNIIGISITELEKRWRIHIQQKKYITEINWKALKENGCE